MKHARTGQDSDVLHHTTLENNLRLYHALRPVLQCEPWHFRFYLRRA